jgi:hypothetical protein
MSIAAQNVPAGTAGEGKQGLSRLGKSFVFIRCYRERGEEVGQEGYKKCRPGGKPGVDLPSIGGG